MSPSLTPTPAYPDRFLYRLYRIGSGLKHRFLRRTTRAGMLLVVGLATTGILGLDPEQSVAYRTFAALSCIALVAAAATTFFRGRFLIERSLPKFATVG